MSDTDTLVAEGLGLGGNDEAPTRFDPEDLDDVHPVAEQFVCAETDHRTNALCGKGFEQLDLARRKGAPIGLAQQNGAGRRVVAQHRRPK